jgi:hypothetical protein
MEMPAGAELRPIAELVPYSANARTHNADQVAQIAASMVEFGWTNSVQIDGAGNVIAGHGRLMAAEALGLSEMAQRPEVLSGREWHAGGWGTAAHQRQGVIFGIPGPPARRGSPGRGGKPAEQVCPLSAGFVGFNPRSRRGGQPARSAALDPERPYIGDASAARC